MAEIDKHRIWVIVGISIVVIAVMMLVLYPQIKKGLFGKVIGASCSSEAPCIGEGEYCTAAGVCASTLVLNYTFDAEGPSATTVTDWSGTLNNAEIHGATWTYEGRVRGAYTFNGVDNYLQVQNAVFHNGSNGAYAFWIKVNPSDSTIRQPILDKEMSTGANYCYAMLYTSSTHLLDVLTSNSGVGLGGAYVVDLTDRWHHVAVTWSSTSGTSLYIDGALISSSLGFPFCSQPEQERFWIGRAAYLGHGFLSGALDEVLVYNRALTPEQIANLYSGYTTCSGTAIGSCTSDARICRDASGAPTIEDCPISGEVCYGRSCQAPACTANVRECVGDGNTRRQCNAYGTGYLPVESCPADQACNERGVCVAVTAFAGTVTRSFSVATVAPDGTVDVTLTVVPTAGDDTLVITENVPVGFIMVAPPTGWMWNADVHRLRLVLAETPIAGTHVYTLRVPMAVGTSTFSGIYALRSSQTILPAILGTTELDVAVCSVAHPELCHSLDTCRDALSKWTPVTDTCSIACPSEYPIDEGDVCSASTLCTASTQRQCTDSTHFQLCNAYGTGWNAAEACPLGQTCSGAGVCGASSLPSCANNMEITPACVCTPPMINDGGYCRSESSLPDLFACANGDDIEASPCSCNSPMINDGGICKNPPSSCISSIPANANLCEGDGAGLSVDTARTLVATCTEATKCEYTCNTGFVLNRGVCVASITGDIDRSGSVNVGDIVPIITQIVSPNPALSLAEFVRLNICSSTPEAIDVFDIIPIINYIVGATSEVTCTVSS